MAALVRLGTLQVRISSQIVACSAIQHSAAQSLWHRSCPNTRRHFCTFTTGLKDEHKGLLQTTTGKQIWKTMHITQRKIKIAALRMYTRCVERIEYDEFFDKCSLPDTLTSWFLVTQLHVWMCMVRMKQEGRAGKYMCRFIVYSMWEDVEQRGKVMGIDAVKMKKAMRDFTEIFYASIFGYDEGIISDDRILSAALWRNLFNMKCDDPRQLELMVEYVRKQMQYLDSLNGEDLLLTGEVFWRPLVETDPQSILKPSPPTYNDEGL
ncbi:hypothetical protein GDO78_004329 [Eleutherodactylus coqui]|uniref:Ubiquinol-cytochrome c chaperone domain-containing protein n=1 Tax=Eleutherodactylus coqui TaxID=57060 RepID=A0A8J6K073_ELECQ|nr:hypothetical protein GDO78_004329 [Eleutherodactylus coqui]